MYHLYHYKEGEGVQTTNTKKGPGPGASLANMANKSKLEGRGSGTNVSTVDSGGPAIDLAFSNNEVQVGIPSPIYFWSLL